jgi:two-component system osmolarity sensor histidine kinase EnvZ
LVVLQILVLSVMMINLVFPLARRSADDLAALLVLASDVWLAKPAGGRDQFVKKLLADDEVLMYEAPQPLADQEGLSPYRRFLRTALATHLPTGVPLRLREDEGDFFEVEFEQQGHRLRFAFSKSKISPQPLRALVWIFASGIVATLALAWLLARRIHAPVARMAEVVRRIARDDQPPRLTENGDAEFAELSHLFNDMAQKLKARRDNQGALLAGVSHDLRSPLARLKMAIGMLAEQTTSPLVGSMEREIEHMDELIGAQLELARAHERESVRAVDLAELLGELVDAAEAGAPGRVHFSAHISACVIPVAPTALRRSVGNLLENALLYSGDLPVEIVCRKSARAVFIGVRDHGPGISSAQAEAVFRPFYRIGTTPHGVGGSGLGLAITRQLAETHGWGLRLKPRSGGGLTAWLRIPLSTSA